MNRATSFLCAVRLLLLGPVGIVAQGSADAAKERVAQDLYPDSVAGLHSQMDELLGLVNSPEQQAFLSALDALAIPVEVDPKTPGVVAIVVLEAKIGGDGRAHGFKVKSGDARYLKQAEDYVRDVGAVFLPASRRFRRTQNKRPMQ